MCPTGATAVWYAPWAKGRFAAGGMICHAETVLNVNILRASVSLRELVSVKLGIRYVAATERPITMFVR